MYKAFISYSHDDEVFARWLHRQLERYRLPASLNVKQLTKRQPIAPVFRDQEELATSADLSASIREAIENSENLIVICSPSAAQSHWVNEEIRQFKQLKKDNRIFCCLVDGDVPDVFPPALRSVEPLAADFRQGTHSRRDAVLRLIAGVLDLGYDELKRRDALGRQRRVAAVVGGSLAATALTTVLAVLAYVGQQRAERQAAVATEISSFLTGLFEVSDPGVAQGNQITVRELLDRGASQVGEKLRADPVVGAQLSTTMGDVYGNLGEIEDALALYRQALEVYASEDGTDGVVYATAQRKLGHLLYLSGDLAAAEQAQVNALSVHLRRLGAEDLEVAADQTALATTRVSQNSSQDVEGLYRRALQTRIAVLGETHLDVAQSHIHLGWFDTYEYRFEEAREHLRKALEIRKSRLGERHFLTSEAMDLLGNLHEKMDDLAQAHVLYSQSLAVKRDVLPASHPLIAESIINLASVEQLMGNSQTAIDLAKQGVRLAEQTLGTLHGDLARGLGIQDMALRAAGQFERSVPVLQRMLDIYEHSFGSDHELVGQALNSLGSLLGEDLEQPDKAEPLLRRAVVIFDQQNSANEWKAIARWSLANSLRDQRQYDEAESLYQSTMSLLKQGQDIDAPNFPEYADLQTDYELLKTRRGGS